MHVLKYESTLSAPCHWQLICLLSLLHVQELLSKLPALKDFCAFRNDTIGREFINAVSLQAMDKLTALDLRGTEVRSEHHQCLYA